MKNKAKKLCFAASTGGHFEQLMMLKPLMKKYDSFVITEKTKYDVNVEGIRTYYLKRKRTIVRILNSLQLFEKIDSTNDTCQKSLV